MIERSDRNNITPQLDCTKFGYQIERELGHNKSGGRVTYLATNTKTATPVVVKQFQFARVGASWSDYHAHQREIELLQHLNHPRIPQHLDSFETTDGFCLVQEYKSAASLAQPQSFTLQEIKQIAVAVLEILVYLQQQKPQVIHRDIKPENILVDRAESLKVYLVDFGLASTEGEEVAATSAVKGTLGFMPPEQMFNRPLTEASDLYSLGATLICLLTKTKSTEIGNLIDENCCINFKPLMPKLNPQFINWLEKMVAPNLKHRYPNAATALTAVQSIDPITPGVKLGRLSSTAKKVLLINLGLVAACATTFTLLKPLKIEHSAITVGELQQMGECVGCNLKGANLKGADLRSLDLTNADLTGADLKGADLRGSSLKNANLTNADLRDADLASTDLRGAIMPDGSIHGND